MREKKLKHDKKKKRLAEKNGLDLNLIVSFFFIWEQATDDDIIGFLWNQPKSQQQQSIDGNLMLIHQLNLIYESKRESKSRSLIGADFEVGTPNGCPLAPPPLTSHPPTPSATHCDVTTGSICGASLHLCLPKNLERTARWFQGSASLQRTVPSFFLPSLSFSLNTNKKMDSIKITGFPECFFVCFPSRGRNRIFFFLGGGGLHFNDSSFLFLQVMCRSPMNSISDWVDWFSSWVSVVEYFSLFGWKRKD